MSTSKIQAHLAKATEVNPGRGQSIKDESYIRELMRAVAKLSDPAWDKLDEAAQDWYNASADSVKNGAGVKPWPDLVEEEKEETSTRRRRSSEDDDSAPKLPKVKKGDKVELKTKKGSNFSGTVIDPDDSGELVIDDGKEEVGIKIENIVELKLVEPPKEEPVKGRRRAAEDDEPPASKTDPEVGDDVELKTKRGTVKVGKVVEINEAIIAIKDITGEEVEFDRDRLESVKVILKAQKAGEKQAGRRRGGEEEGGEDEKDSKAGQGKATLRARELVLDNLDLSKEEHLAKMKKEFPDCKETTVKLIYTEVHKLIKMLEERDMLKAGKSRK